MEFAVFNAFEVELPRDAIEACSHTGRCDADVEQWAPLIQRTKECTPEALQKELYECGAWEEDELQDDQENWKRIIWIAAGNISEERAIR